MLKLTGLDEQRFPKKTDGLTFSLDLRDHIQQQIFWYGRYETKVIQWLRKNLNEGDVVIDAGANIGMHTLTAASLVGKEGMVYAFEPSSKTYKQLLDHIAANNFANVVAENIALGRQSADATLYLSSVDNIGMTSLKPSSNFSGVTENVPVISLDEYVKKKSIGKVNLIKLDIEGYEFEALMGMKDIIQQMQPMLLIEVSNTTLARMSSSASDIYNLLYSFGYSAYSLALSGLPEPLQEKNIDDIVVFAPATKNNIPSSKTKTNN